MPHAFIALRPRLTRSIGLALLIALALGSWPSLPDAQASPAASGSATAAEAASAATSGATVSARRAAAKKRWPTPASTGVPKGWAPRRTLHRDVVVRRAGAVVKDLRIINANLIVEAPNVTVKRVEIIGGKIENFPYGDCHSGMVVKRSTIRRGASGDFYDHAIGTGGYTARRVEMLDVLEGFRVGGRFDNCGPVKIRNSYARVTYPTGCNDDGWHGDGIQGYEGGRLTIRNTVLVMVEGPNCGGTAPFFYPGGQGNASVDIDRLVVQGGGYPFRLGQPGRVRNLKIVDDSWTWGPIDVACSLVSSWKANIVQMHAKGTRSRSVRRQPCDTEL